MAYICGEYNKKSKAIGRLALLILVTEELKDDYVEGQIIEVGQRRYVLSNRHFVAPGTVVQYDMLAQKDR